MRAGVPFAPWRARRRRHRRACRGRCPTRCAGRRPRGRKARRRRELIAAHVHGGVDGRRDGVGAAARERLLELLVDLAQLRLQRMHAGRDLLDAALEARGRGLGEGGALLRYRDGAGARRQASMRRTLEPVEDSDTILNRPSSAVFLACVPPHSSRENGSSALAHGDDAHRDAVLSPKRATAPEALASSMPMTWVTTGWAARICSFTRSSTARICSEVMASKCVKSKRRFSGERPGSPPGSRDRPGPP